MTTSDRNLAITAIECSISKPALPIADRAFLSETPAKIAPVNRVKNHHLSPAHPIADRLTAALMAITKGQNSQDRDWTFKINI